MLRRCQLVAAIAISGLACSTASAPEDWVPPASSEGSDTGSYTGGTSGDPGTTDNPGTTAATGDVSAGGSDTGAGTTGRPPDSSSGDPTTTTSGGPDATTTTSTTGSTTGETDEGATTGPACEDLEEEPCNLAPGCFAYYGGPVVLKNRRLCVDAYQFLGCGPDPGGCDDAITYACDGDKVYEFLDTCTLPGLEPCEVGTIPYC